MNSGEAPIVCSSALAEAESRTSRSIRMRFPKIALAAAVVGVSFSAPAIAQDFNGPFIGVQAGLNSDNLRNPNTAIGRVPMDDNRQSFTGGIYAGYDYQVKDKVVIGGIPQPEDGTEKPQDKPKWKMKL